MKSIGSVIFASMCLAACVSMPVFADGEACSPGDTRQSDGALQKAEDAEKAGRIKEAYTIVSGGIPSIHCAPNGYKRRDGLLERTSLKLGEQAEKAGKFGEAFEYYHAPYAIRVDSDLTNADRVMLKYAKDEPGDFAVVSRAAHYFTEREKKASLKEVRAIALKEGDQILAQEDKAFTARKDSLDDLQKAREWLGLAGEEKRALARAEQRGDSLIAEGSIRSVERAFAYYHFSANEKKMREGRDRARKLGDEQAQKGNHSLAMKFYDLSGDQDKAAAIEKKKEKQEEGRKEKFKQEQKSLEEELGL